MDADIRCDGEAWCVVATHPGMASLQGRAQVEQVLQSLDPPAMPAIVPGDLNAWLIDGMTLRPLISHFYRARSPGIFPPRYALFALDRIRVHPNEHLARVDVHRSLLGAGDIGSPSVDRVAILVDLKQTLVTKTP